MGIRFSCPNGHKLNVKTFLAGKRAICPDCGAKVIVPILPEQSTTPSFAGSPGVAVIGRPTPQRFVEPDAPSVIIAVAENELPLAAQIEAPSVTIPEALPDSIIAATIPSPALLTPVTGAAEPVYDPQRERTRRNQMLMVVALLFVVVILAGILIWVLKRSAAQTPTSDPEPAMTSRVSPIPIQAKA